jgi:hypothetical protein
MLLGFSLAKELELEPLLPMNTAYGLFGIEKLLLKNEVIAKNPYIRIYNTIRYKQTSVVVIIILIIIIIVIRIAIYR